MLSLFTKGEVTYSSVGEALAIITTNTHLHLLTFMMQVLHTLYIDIMMTA